MQLGLAAYVSISEMGSWFYMGHVWLLESDS